HRTQHLQPSTPSRLTLDAPDLPSRGGGSMAGCGCRGVIVYSARRFCSAEVKLTVPRWTSAPSASLRGGDKTVADLVTEAVITYGPNWSDRDYRITSRAPRSGSADRHARKFSHGRNHRPASGKPRAVGKPFGQEADLARQTPVLLD